MTTDDISAKDAALSVSRLTSVPIVTIERLWRHLESRAAGHPFFLSWAWLGTLLETVGAPATLLVARSGDRIVGLGLVFPSRRRRFGVAWPALSLNETGNAAIDSIYIEDNGFLAEAGHERDVTAACLHHLVEADAAWAELRLSGVSALVADEARRLSLAIAMDRQDPCPFVDLRGIGAGDFHGFGANARQQIARAERLYRARGELTVLPSPDLAEAMTRFAEMKQLHQQRWQQKGKPGAFAEPSFERFHRALLSRTFAAGKVDILRVSAGDETIGLLHTFFHGGDAYAYQNGFRYESDRRLKPGLVSHALAIRYCRANDLGRYRMLAGDSRYKRSLGNDSYPLHWLSVRRPHFAFRLERVAYRIAGRG